MLRARVMAILCGFLPLALALLSGTGPARSPGGSVGLPTWRKDPKHTVLVISIDGLRPDYLADTKHALPNLRRLENEGARARSMKSVWPSLTYPAHATLVTGVLPARHGIVNNEVFDPFRESDSAWYWYAQAFRVPTLWDAASEAGISVGNVTWPVTVGARIRHNIPQFWRAKTAEDEKVLDLLSSPGLYAEVGRAASPPGEHRTDRSRADAAVTILRSKRPGLMFVYFTDLDTAQHMHGPMSPLAWRELERIDAFIGDILVEASKLPKLAVAVVSDHGFLPVDTDVRPNVALREAGLLTTRTSEDAGRAEVLTAFEAITWKAGGSAAIMGRNGRDEPTASRVKELFEKLAADPANRISEVLDGAEVERSQGGFPGAIVVLQAARGATFSERLDPPMVAPSKYRGMHGHRPDMPEMGAFFLLWGAGVQPGNLGDFEMIDVAPTLAAVLGVPLPSAQGRVVREALAP